MYWDSSGYNTAIKLGVELLKNINLVRKIPKVFNLYDFWSFYIYYL